MPELPEVEVTRRSVAPDLLGARVSGVEIGLPLRWPLGCDPARLRGLKIGAMSRRGKYLWLPLGPDDARAAPVAPGLPVGRGATNDASAARTTASPLGTIPADNVPAEAPSAREQDGGLLIHLGMSGALGLVPEGTPAGPYDHFRLHTERGCLRLTDPRRFGAVVWSSALDVDPARKLLAGLGPEPFDTVLDSGGFHRALQTRRVAVKSALLSGDLVVGAGNIYACESLHLAGIDPRTPANKVSRPRAERLLAAIRHVLQRAIDAGGSTLKDFNANGAAGHYQEQAQVYGRAGQPCLRCGAAIRRLVQGQRSTFFCPSCQKR